jgi:hypothetical protein
MAVPASSSSGISIATLLHVLALHGHECLD